jgi:amino acid adenylation domain-containing protein
MASLLHHLLSEAADRDPDHEAVRIRGRSLTYGELEVMADGIATTLAGSGVARGDRVGLHLPKSVEMVAAVYGVMRAGAAYVPLDPRAPAARIGVIANDCELAGLVTTPDRAATLLPLLERGDLRTIILADDDGPTEVDLPVATVSFDEAITAGPDPRVGGIDTDLAYILYTSGSTGIPKGVMLSHRHALNFVRWCASVLDVGPDDTLSNHAPLHFDLSVFDLYLSALAGATVAPVAEELTYLGAELGAFVENEAVTVWYSVPSALILLARSLRSPDQLASLRTVVFAGEVYPTPQLRRLQELVPRASLWNLYGPTETNVCTYYRVDQLPDDHVAIPIGRACENTEVFAVTEDGRVAGVGETGELHVRGTAVMDGYWRRPELSASVLVPDPRQLEPGQPVYRTGDLVRPGADGNYEFLGRRDHQIKSRGYRIELGDIEAALGADPTLAESAAVAVPHPEWGTAVVAWVVPRNGTAVDERTVRGRAARLLPRYMVPARVEVTDALPRTSNGKIDRQRLLASTATPDPGE